MRSLPLAFFTGYYESADFSRFLLEKLIPNFDSQKCLPKLLKTFLESALKTDMGAVSFIFTSRCCKMILMISERLEADMKIVGTHDLNIFKSKYVGYIWPNMSRIC